MEVILFDWNGTIINDTEIWWKGVEAVYSAFGKKPPTIIGYFQQFAAANGDYLEVYRSTGITAPREDLNKIYEPFYESHMQEISLFPGVKGVLESLNRRGIIMGLITIQKESLTVQFLKKFGIEKIFSYREFGAIDKVGIIRRIIQEEGVSPQKCCYVGDMPSDMLQGKEVGVATVAFLNGYVPKKLMRELMVVANPDDFMEDFRDLPGILSKIETEKRS